MIKRHTNNEFYIKPLYNGYYAVIDGYDNLVKSGEIIPPHETKLEALLSVARGHPDNEGTQAARRLLKKRYGIISW